MNCKKLNQPTHCVPTTGYSRTLTRISFRVLAKREIQAHHDGRRCSFNTHTHTHTCAWCTAVLCTCSWGCHCVCVCVFASFPCCVPLTPLAPSAVSAVGKSQTLHGTRQSVCVWLCNALRAPRCRSAIASFELNQRTRIENIVEYIFVWTNNIKCDVLEIAIVNFLLFILSV